MKLAKVTSYGSQQYLTPALAAKVERLLTAARAEGVPAPFLAVVSGWRSYDRQAALWAAALARAKGDAAKARRKVAPPGRSLHNSGDSADLWLGPGTTDTDESRRLALTSAAVWLRRNVGRFGLRFYDEAGEPWHIEDADVDRESASERAKEVESPGGGLPWGKIVLTGAVLALLSGR